ncbi:MAG: D-alanine--poly(phosphoribitol) ligase subunit DltA [Anaerovoracaceae bacterium]
MLLLNKIEEFARQKPTQIAIHSQSGCMTYHELNAGSDKLASWIKENLGSDKRPIVIYGHKNPYMIMCFLACVKSGRAYCPIDISVPETRRNDIISAINPLVIFTTESLSSNDDRLIDIAKIYEIISNQSVTISHQDYVKPTDIFYILFTSGSTGNPKGVQITASNLSNFLNWCSSLGEFEKPGETQVWMNQAPFSFDLSVMDLYTCLFTGGSLWTLNKETQGNIGVLFESFAVSAICNWVSTPSFAELCLADPYFNEKLLPSLETFLFCGETLPNSTAAKLMDRFTNAKVINTYGPTESTVAVTSVLITEELTGDSSPLPVGTAKPGTTIEIHDENNQPLPDGKKGEIVIIGDTVSKGYFNDQERTDKAFFKSPEQSYKTGDEGYLLDGMLYYSGRIDLQIKLHGYRIELEDIENNLLKINEIQSVAVLPKYKNNKIASLTAFVVNDDETKRTFSDGKNIKTQLKAFLPEYMIPKRIIFLDSLPVTANGKVDRAKLREVV